MKSVQFILYVRDQAKSKEFYSKVLQKTSCLDIPGMTEFELFDNIKLGLMPEKGIAKIIVPSMPHPEKATGIPRCELYIPAEHPQRYVMRAIEAGGINVSELKNRNWGDKVAYVADPDGHIIAFASKIK